MEVDADTTGGNGHGLNERQRVVGGKGEWGAALGKMIRFRYPAQPIFCIMPRLPDGSAEVVMAVMPAEVLLLRSDECFRSYLDASR